MQLASSGSNTIRVKFSEEIVSMGVSPEDRTTKTRDRFDKGSDDGRATFAKSNTN